MAPATRRHKAMPREVASIMMEYDAINARATDYDERANRVGYHVNLINFEARWRHPKNPHLQDLARQAFLNARPHDVEPTILYQHQPFAHPYGPPLRSPRVSFTPSFSYVTHIDFHMPRTTRVAHDLIIDKIFAVCPQLKTLHVVVRGLDEAGDSWDALEEVVDLMHSIEIALSKNTTVRVKTLDFCPEFVGISETLMPYNSANPRRVRIGKWDLRSYFEQVQPLQMLINEFTLKHGHYLVTAMYYMALLKEFRGYQVDGFKWAFDQGQAVPGFLARAALAHPKQKTIFEPEMRQALKEVLDQKAVNRLHWPTRH
ncbi:hypothetical protein M409DRAFT_22320 [Zasmidium cellare ATCC 36951]|uniref:Uncharacterized protein n=1 Tax=Zasmidium cellare ATCC 36951 TaxID=1080233 RepID=A0A6A6CNL8_ZASCE|nr:uncharacterized protein M409DRAFT_22320 [Zasmidium cellare ATCC 36951]KAF2167512.1 hypothetical protein M409DRAFT_22320 [Zasmidium cellare ATCC 36951]